MSDLWSALIAVGAVLVIAVPMMIVLHRAEKVRRGK